MGGFLIDDFVREEKKDPVRNDELRESAREIICPALDIRWEGDERSDSDGRRFQGWENMLRFKQIITRIITSVSLIYYFSQIIIKYSNLYRTGPRIMLNWIKVPLNVNFCSIRILSNEKLFLFIFYFFTSWNSIDIYNLNSIKFL